MKLASLPVTLLVLLVAPVGPWAADPPQFEADVRPIFREYCFDCHGATDKLEGKLDLRLVRFLIKGGESGPAIVPGDAAASYLLQRLANGEMPPEGSRVPAEKVDVLRRWIDAGAPTRRDEPEQLEPGLPVTSEDRGYWAFQPIQRPPVPEYGSAERVRTPIDALLRQAMPQGLSFSAESDRVTLIKRVYFDLVGLPPTTAELERWRTDPREDWYTALIDETLESPHYGERWARHWLDVAGYADSDGFTTADADRPWAWKYRDYVIRSLNADKPFDRFVTEQLAGDDLAGPAQGDWTPEQIELLTATGFLRMAADGTGSGDNSPEARNKVIADTLKIVGSSLLGLSLNCAQCHDHRYDPIPQTDYFAIRAVFDPALDWQNWKTPGERLVSLYTTADRQKAAEVEQQAQAVAQQREAKQREYMTQALDKELQKYDEPLREQLRTAYKTRDSDRTAEQKALLAKHPSVNITPGVLYQYLPEAAEDLKKYDQKVNDIRATKPHEEFLHVLQEPPGTPPVTRLFHRGDHQQPQREIAPAGLTVLAPAGHRQSFAADDPAVPTTGRRLAFAQWLTDKDNPLLARVIVNRVWLHHFGRGLVGTPGDFGKLGSPPTHPELLDWLAAEFRESGWSLKSLHRLILTSTAWRQSSYRDPNRDRLDPENRFFWRKSLQRLDAEILRDRMLAASGTLHRDLYGPPVAIKEDETGQVIVDGQQTRRSLYVRVRRTQPVAMLQSFDAPVMEINCELRPVSTVATQSLMLLNGEFAIEQAGRLADAVLRETSTLTAEQLAALPPLPAGPGAPWSHGSGRFDEESQRVVNFSLLTHWTGRQWQGGPSLPDAAIGWVFLNGAGGHPGNAPFAAVRRWTAPRAGVLDVAGSLHHPSESGDGVRGRIVSSSRGLIGQWQVHHATIETQQNGITVQAGDAIDFITDCLAHETSDSFDWGVKLTLKGSDGKTDVFDSAASLGSPMIDNSRLAAQIQRAWRLALCREPSPEEFHLAANFAARQLRVLAEDQGSVPEGSSAERQVVVNLCQMLLNSNEFLYVN